MWSPRGFGTVLGRSLRPVDTLPAPEAASRSLGSCPHWFHIRLLFHSLPSCIVSPVQCLTCAVSPVGTPLCLGTDSRRNQQQPHPPGSAPRFRAPGCPLSPLWLGCPSSPAPPPPPGPCAWHSEGTQKPSPQALGWEEASKLPAGPLPNGAVGDGGAAWRTENPSGRCRPPWVLGAEEAWHSRAPSLGRSQGRVAFAGHDPAAGHRCQTEGRWCHGLPAAMLGPPDIPKPEGRRWGRSGQRWVGLISGLVSQRPGLESCSTTKDCVNLGAALISPTHVFSAV